MNEIKTWQASYNEDFQKNGHDCSAQWEHVAREITELRAALAERDRLAGMAVDYLEVTDIAPEANCSCHSCPPCGDCVEWSHWRYVREALERTIDAMREGGES